MSMLDSFFSKGFKASKCKTLLKLTIPRIKLLRNRREIQIKQMRRDIAKLLETGQEATARIRVEHIIREENMMAAHEIVELFCELISVRLPIIETQRECPIDLKEAISSICFAAPRCADLPELLQVQISFAGKYGREFVVAATELMPDCGVNRQLIELLSIRAPSAEKKLKILKQIAEEYNLDWDPAASETELFKSHEDLLNGPTQFVSGTKLLLPEEKHEDISHPVSNQAHEEEEHDDFDADFDFDLPEVPKVLIRPGENVASAPTVVAQPPTAPHHEISHDSSDHFRAIDKPPQEEEEEEEEPRSEERSGPTRNENGEKQFVPFISPPSVSFSLAQSDTSSPPPPLPVVSRSKSEVNVPFISPPSVSISLTQSDTSSPPPPLPVVSRSKSEVNVDLRDVIAAAQAAADSAERAAAAARSAASLAQVRIDELTRKNSISESPFLVGSPPTNRSVSTDEMKPNFDRSESLKAEEFDDVTLGGAHESDQTHHNQPQRLPSMDDEYFSYPNLFGSQSANLGSPSQSFKDNDSRSPDER